MCACWSSTFKISHSHVAMQVTIQVSTTFFGLCRKQATIENGLQVKPGWILTSQGLGFGINVWMAFPLIHGSANRLKIHYGEKMNNCDLRPDWIIWRQGWIRIAYLTFWLLPILTSIPPREEIWKKIVFKFSSCHCLMTSSIVAGLLR